MQDKLPQVLAKLGKSAVFTSGDASEYMGRTCYRLGDGKTTIEFNEWAIGAGCLLSYRTSADQTKCAPLKAPKGNQHVEINGLKLGMSKSAVLKVLGKPTKMAPNKWVYDLHGTAKDNTPLQHSIYRTYGFEKGYPYYWYFYIEVGFKGSAVSRLALSPYAEQ